MRTLLVLIAATSALPGCDGAVDADVAGNYSIAVTNRDNGCNFDNWMVGNTAQNIPLTVTQDDDRVTASVGGLTATFLDLWLGDHVFTGYVNGNTLDLDLIGTRALTEGNCAYTINALIHARISGDALEGTLIYTAATNDNPDCGSLEGCESQQDFNGTRPPQ